MVRNTGIFPLQTSLVAFLAVLLSCLPLLSSCTQVKPQRQTVKADIRIKVEDPVVQRITAITDRFDLEASGKFKGGSFMVRDKTLKFAPDTTFTLKLTLPIEDPKVISTKGATGELVTSQPISINGIPAPEKLILKKGTVTGDVDIVRTIGIFIFNVLENQNVSDEGGGDWKRAFQQLTINRSSLVLRPDSSMDLGKQHIHIGKDSQLEFKNLVVDSDFNYTGQCIVDVNFANQNTYRGTKIDIDFNGGSMLINFDAKRKNGIVTLSAPGNQKPIKLTDCIYRFGKEKGSNARANTVLLNEKRFVWQKTEGTDKPAIHFSADMMLQKTVLHILNTKLNLLANFPTSVPAKLDIDRKEDGLMETNFNTPNLVPAANADITMHRQNEDVNVKLADALVGPISIAKFGDLQLSLANGNAKLREISWGTDEHGFKLSTAGGSTLSITKGMSMDLVKDQEGLTCTLPITLKLGQAQLTSNTMKLGLANLNGNMVMNIDKGVDLDGKINFSVANSNLFGSNKTDVSVNGLSVDSKNGNSSAQLRNCSIVVPMAALQDQIEEHLPDDKVFPINKTMLAERKWRYRNAIVESMTLHNPRLDKIEMTSPGVAKFTASGDADAKGTIEKGGILSVIKGPAKWEKRPWSASAHLIGTGVVNYKILANDALSKSELDYSASIDLPLPDDIDLDWSQVNDGLLEKAERNAVVKSIQKLKPLHLDFKDKQVKLFPNGQKNFNALKLKNLKSHPVASGLQLDFNASANF
ncbi:MAG TPA: hypothetical protein V6C89_20420 [Drouetiella sp.]|jgi:hypothetical protein